MTHWFNLGMSHPLTLGMAHPLADRLETLARPDVNKSWARSVTATLLLGVATLSAPLTIAEGHPEKTLEDTVVTSNSSKSVIKIHKTHDDGHEIEKHFEIELNGDDFEAFEFDKDGNKSKIEMSDIEGFDAETAKKSNTWAFVVGDDDELKFEDGLETHQVFKTIEGDQHIMRVKKGGDGSKSTRVFSWTETPSEPPMPPSDFRSFDDERVFIMQGEEMRADAQLSAARSMLESVEDMLESIEDTKETKDDLKDARRDLEKARKTLQETERRLQKTRDAE